MSGSGTPGDPWDLTTPPGKSGYQIWRDEEKNVLHCQVGKTWLHYKISALDDALAMLKAHGDWMELGNKDEKVDTKEGTVEHWARSGKAGGVIYKAAHRVNLERVRLLIPVTQSPSRSRWLGQKCWSPQSSIRTRSGAP